MRNIIRFKKKYIYIYIRNIKSYIFPKENKKLFTSFLASYDQPELYFSFIL